MARGSSRLTKPWQTPNTEECEHGRQTAGANVRRRRGKQPRPPAKVPKSQLSGKRGGKAIDSQEVGLEAAIL